MKCHEVDYEIFGDDIQVVEVELDPDESVIAEAGAMVYMDAGIEFKAKLGDGSDVGSGFFGKLGGIGKRMLTGESIFLTHFTNSVAGKKRVAFSAPYPGKIMAIDMANIGGELMCQKGAFLCAAKAMHVGVGLTKRFGAGMFGKEGFILQKLQGDGMAFIHAGGTLIEKKLAGGRLMVDTGCIVGFTSGVEYSVQAAGGLKSMLFGGEGVFLATLEGTGTVYLQSMPFAKLAERIIEYLPKPANNG